MKASAATAEYSTEDKYIFIVNNGTKNLLNTDIDDRYVLDDLHITFYSDAAGTQPIGNTTPGYVLDQLTASYDGDTVYRIKAPTGAEYFQLNNGTGKGTPTNPHNYERHSEIKKLTADGIYRFVRKADVIADNDKGYVLTAGYPGDGNMLWSNLNAPSYRLELLNKQETEEPDEPVIETASEDLHLATIETGYDGLTRKILWLKPQTAEGQTFDETNPATYIPETVDTDYLDHVFSDIQNEAVTQVRVKKWGSYYWKEVVAPYGYQIDTEILPTFTVGADEAELATYITSAMDTPLPGQVRLTKTAKEAAGTVDIGEKLGAGYGFKLAKETDNPAQPLYYRLAKKAGKSEYYVVLPDDEQTDKQKAELQSMLSELDEDDNHVWEVTVNGDDISFVYYNVELGGDNFKPVVTDSESHIYVENLPWGNYYFEEYSTPSGSLYADKDIGTWDNSNYNALRVTNNRVSFAVGRNNCETLQEVTCKDEKLPAYLMLWEHINELRPNEWGCPTFIFKIQQTGYYNESGTITPKSNGKEIVVALTVNNQSQITSVDVFGNGAFDGWYYEYTGNTPASEELFGVNSYGMIEVEPGTYTVSRINTSRYEFVTNYSQYLQPNMSIPAAYSRSDYGTPVAYGQETIASIEVPPYTIADIHYYDQVAYYDKLSDVERKVNKFHGIKGIRIDDKGLIDVQNGTQQINLTALDAYIINSDGTERMMTDEEKNALVITYTSKKSELLKEVMRNMLKASPYYLSDYWINRYVNEKLANDSYLVPTEADYEPAALTTEAKTAKVIEQLLIQQTLNKGLSALTASLGRTPTEQEVGVMVRNELSKLRTAIDEQFKEAVGSTENSTVSGLRDDDRFGSYRAITEDGGYSYNAESGTITVHDPVVKARAKETNDFLFDGENNYIQITNPDRYANGIYTLHAAFNGVAPDNYTQTFETDFDLIFDAKDKDVIYYTRQVIFKADGSQTNGDNISYYLDETDPDKLEREAEYEFTFLIYQDKTDNTYKVKDVRHNGRSVGFDSAGWAAAVNAVISNSENTLLINPAYRAAYAFNSYTPSVAGLTNYSDIESYILSNLPALTENSTLPVSVSPAIEWTASVRRISANP